MTNGSLERIGILLGNVSGLVGASVRQEGQAGAFNLGEMLEPEVTRLRGESQDQLADAVAALGEGNGK